METEETIRGYNQEFSDFIKSNKTKVNFVKYRCGGCAKHCLVRSPIELHERLGWNNVFEKFNLFKGFVIYECSKVGWTLFDK